MTMTERLNTPSPAPSATGSTSFEFEVEGPDVVLDAPADEDVVEGPDVPVAVTSPGSSAV